MTASENKPELDLCNLVGATAAIVEHTHKFIIVRRDLHHFKCFQKRRVIGAMAGSVVVRDKKSLGASAPLKPTLSLLVTSESRFISGAIA